MALKLTTSFVADSLSLFAYYKRLGETAMDQIPDQQLFQSLDSESNSIAIIVKHLFGNMCSRWTDFLTTDGEKPSRNRDEEFVSPPATRAEVLIMWKEGWSRLERALDQITDADLGRTITIRGEAHSVMQAINRQLAHYPYHVGQIVFLAKHFAGNEWHSLSIPRNHSDQFNRGVASGEFSQR